MPIVSTDITAKCPCKYAPETAPSRDDDERLLAIIRGLEARGMIVTFDPVSPYLMRPLRSEAMVRKVVRS